MQGFHHIALATRDLDATMQFYGDILGMEIGEVMERHQRHCFIKPGGDTWGMHFFEADEAEIFTRPDLLTNRYVFLPGALQHIAFAMDDEAAALRLRERLQAHHIAVTEVNHIGTIYNFLFVDNNGMLLEITWE